jgi:hypothetical protein
VDEGCEDLNRYLTATDDSQAAELIPAIDKSLLFLDLMTPPDVLQQNSGQFLGLGLII